MEIKDVAKLATLSRIEMTEEELTAMARDFDSILEYVAQIKEVSTDSASSDPSVGMHYNVMREDGEPHKTGEYSESIEKNMPRSEDGYLSVKKIL